VVQAVQQAILRVHQAPANLLLAALVPSILPVPAHRAVPAVVPALAHHAPADSAHAPVALLPAAHHHLRKHRARNAPRKKAAAELALSIQRPKKAQ
jgi:hypothetical protein